MDILINLDVDDLPKAIAFYSTVFGLSVRRRFGNGGVELAGGSSALFLLQKEAGTRGAVSIAQARSYERHWTPVHLDFVVDDIEVAIGKAVENGAKLEKPYATSNWGKLALMADPFGHGFCLVEFLGRGYDEIATPA